MTPSRLQEINKWMIPGSVAAECVEEIERLQQERDEKQDYGHRMDALAEERLIRATELETLLASTRAELETLKTSRGPFVDVADLKAEECGCNVVLKRYSNPFHRPYYRVSHCEFHKNAKELRESNTRLTAELADIWKVVRRHVEEIEKLESELSRMRQALHDVWCTAEKALDWPSVEALLKRCNCIEELTREWSDIEVAALGTVSKEG